MMELHWLLKATLNKAQQRKMLKLVKDFGAVYRLYGNGGEWRAFHVEDKYFEMLLCTQPIKSDCVMLLKQMGFCEAQEELK